MNKTKRLTTLAVCVAAAMILSFIESQIPSFIPIPGVKLGLANAATLFVIYKFGAREGAFVSAVRVSLSSILFGSVSSFLYAAAGAALSFGIMLLLKRTEKFSITAISITGGVTHNIAQILVSMLILQTEVVIFYLPALLISGIATGAVIGIISALLVEKLNIKL